MTVSISGTNGVTFPDGTVQTTTGKTGMVNRIINGAMVMAQYSTGSVTPTNATYGTVDRWQFRLSQASKYTAQQNAGSVTPPAGFTNYLGITSSSAYTVGSGDYFAIQQAIEYANMSDFDWASGSGQTVTLSFWVRSSLTGSFGGCVFQYSDGYPSYPFSYTISSANTWTKISVSIPAPTSGTWTTGNSGSVLVVQFSLGCGTTYSGTANTWSYSNLYRQPTGSTSVVGTNGATFYITGVQLEKGSTATSFDYRSYSSELAMCQRYYQVAKSNVNVAATSSAINGIIPLLVQLRSDTITVGKTSGTFSMGDMVSAGFTSTSTPTDSGYLNNSLSVSFNLTGFSGLTTYRTYRHEPNSTNAAIFTVSAEL